MIADERPGTVRQRRELVHQEPHRLLRRSGRVCHVAFAPVRQSTAIIAQVVQLVKCVCSLGPFLPSRRPGLRRGRSRLWFQPASAVFRRLRSGRWGWSRPFSARGYGRSTAPASSRCRARASCQGSPFLTMQTSAGRHRCCARPTTVSEPHEAIGFSRQGAHDGCQAWGTGGAVVAVCPPRNGRDPRKTGIIAWRPRRHDETQASHWHPDLSYASGAGLLLRRQDRLRGAAGGRGRALLPLAAPAVRQEPVPRHAEGAVRRQRAAIPRLGRPRRVGLVGQPCRGPPELRGRRLHAARLSARGPRGSTGGPRGTRRAFRCGRSARRCACGV